MKVSKPVYANAYPEHNERLPWREADRGGDGTSTCVCGGLSEHSGQVSSWLHLLLGLAQSQFKDNN
jgi:hypothetical protein